MISTDVWSDQQIRSNVRRQLVPGARASYGVRTISKRWQRIRGAATMSILSKPYRPTYLKLQGMLFILIFGVSLFFDRRSSIRHSGSHLSFLFKSLPWVLAARFHASTAYAVMRCPSVRPSFTFVNSVKTNNVHIFNNFSKWDTHTILVFPYQRSWQYSDGTFRLTGASNAAGVGTNCDSGDFLTNRLLIDDYCSANNKCDRPPYSLTHPPSRISESMFITACSIDDHDNEKRTEQLYAALNMEQK